MNESHIQSAENEIEAIKQRILDREKTMALKDPERHRQESR